MDSCLYCELNAGPAESEHFLRFLESPETTVYLHRDQTLPGRVVVATREHFEDIELMPPSVHEAFFGQARRAAAAIKKAFPQTCKINLALCGNAPEARHPHLHVLPRHEGDRRWPDFFLDYVQPYWPRGDARYDSTVAALLAAMPQPSSR